MAFVSDVGFDESQSAHGHPGLMRSIRSKKETTLVKHVEYRESSQPEIPGTDG